MTIGDIAYCHCHNCKENDGDCDSDDDCVNNLVCGTNNCPEDLGFESNIDCCYTPLLGDEKFCSVEFPCKKDEGDCDFHAECGGSFLLCGSKNCRVDLGFDNQTDCCYQVTFGDEDFCTTDSPCYEQEGDCDSHDECQDGLDCGSNNCIASLGFDAEIDCCYQVTFGDEVFVQL